MRSLQKVTRILECGVYRTDTGLEVRAGYRLEELRQVVIRKGGFKELSPWDPSA